ncbi:MAG: hypothetical protein L3J34_04875 [Flavobacteriaceae bacterium]|nr:hypothetical protein [Flavobacteriaceae bacterium]
MRFFQISLLFFILVSCSLPTTRGLLEKPVERQYTWNNYFSNEKIDYLYKAKINIYNKNFGGILIIKKIKDNHHRIVFTTEMGSKIFDFEIVNNDFKVNYIFDELNRNIILNTLKNDFVILVKQFVHVSKQFDSKEEHIYQSTFKQSNNYYFYKKNMKQLCKIINTTKNKEKVIIYFSKIKNEIATNIVLEHQDFKYKIDLTSINK